MPCAPSAVSRTAGDARLLRISVPPAKVDGDERAGARLVEDLREVLDVRAEGREVPCAGSSSPTSVRTTSKRATREPAFAATGRPARTISAASPSVFRATVLPPAFGPGDDHRAPARRRVSSLGDRTSTPSSPRGAGAAGDAARCDSRPPRRRAGPRGGTSGRPRPGRPRSSARDRGEPARGRADVGVGERARAARSRRPRPATRDRERRRRSPSSSRATSASSIFIRLPIVDERARLDEHRGAAPARRVDDAREALVRVGPRPGARSRPSRSVQ